MTRPVAQLALVLTIMAAVVTMAGLPIVAHAQAVTCGPGSGTFVRAVGSQAAPMLVPAQVPVTICSQHGAVIAVLPAFRTVGPPSVPMLVPTGTTVVTCAPAATVATPILGAGLVPRLQFVTSGSGVVIVNSVGTTTAPATVITGLPTVFTCF
jgi:hypothetical protein